MPRAINYGRISNMLAAMMKDVPFASEGINELTYALKELERIINLTVEPPLGMYDSATGRHLISRQNAGTGPAGPVGSVGPLGTGRVGAAAKCQKNLFMTPYFPIFNRGQKKSPTPYDNIFAFMSSANNQSFGASGSVVFDGASIVTGGPGAFTFPDNKTMRVHNIGYYLVGFNVYGIVKAGASGGYFEQQFAQPYKNGAIENLPSTTAIRSIWVNAAADQPEFSLHGIKIMSLTATNGFGDALTTFFSAGATRGSDLQANKCNQWAYKLDNTANHR